MLDDKVIRNFVVDGKLNLTVSISRIEKWQKPTNENDAKPKHISEFCMGVSQICQTRKCFRASQNLNLRPGPH
jgi:hypothetical protein